MLDMMEETKRSEPDSRGGSHVLSGTFILSLATAGSDMDRTRFYLGSSMFNATIESIRCDDSTEPFWGFREMGIPI